MNFNVLTNRAMLVHSESWLTDRSLGKALEAHPLGKPILTELAEAHANLAKKQEQRGAAATSLRDLGEVMTGLDLDHDRYARALFYHLVAMVESAANDQAAETFQTLLGKLFPEGLYIVRRSYTEEAQEAVLRDERIEQSDRDLMAVTQVGDYTLADLYDRWHEAGDQLGRKANEYAELEAAMGPELAAATASDVQTARRQWIKTVTTLFQIAELIPLAPGLLASLREPVEKSIRALGRQRRSTTEEDCHPGPGSRLAASLDPDPSKEIELIDAPRDIFADSIEDGFDDLPSAVEDGGAKPAS